MFAARQFLARGRVSVRPRFVAARVAPIGAVRHFSGNPMDMIQAQLAEATAKLQEIAKEPQQMIQPHLEQAGANTLEKINGLVVGGIVLSRSQHLPEKELEEKLGALLPPQLVEVVKKQAKLLPPDPLMEEIQELKKLVAELKNKK